jgi:hypothetical protein
MIVKKIKYSLPLLILQYNLNEVKFKLSANTFQNDVFRFVHTNTRFRKIRNINF